MRALAVALLAAALCALVAVAAAARAVPVAGCSKAAARAAVLDSSLPKRWKDAARKKHSPYEGVSVLLCHDFTRDGRVDMAFTFASGGTAGDVAWVVFRRAGAGWKLALSRLSGYKIALRRAGADIVETQPIYLENDPNCCPTGGYAHTRWSWNGRRFAAVRAWRTKRF